MDELRDFLRSRGKITLTLVVVNILLFFVMDFRGNTENGGYMLAHGAAYGPLILENGEYYRLFTSMFLHFGIEHLFGNMLTLIFLGDLLEKMIGKFRFATPGRLGNYTDETAPEDGAQTTEHSAAGRNGNSQAERIIALLGGRENIVLVDACMTRLRVTVKDISKVAELPEWKSEGALGLIKKDQGIQAVYGPKADVLKSDINDIL